MLYSARITHTVVVNTRGQVLPLSDGVLNVLGELGVLDSFLIVHDLYNLMFHKLAEHHAAVLTRLPQQAQLRLILGGGGVRKGRAHVHLHRVQRSWL